MPHNVFPHTHRLAFTFWRAVATCLAAATVCCPGLAAAGGKLQIIVVDKQTGQPIPCRMHLRSANGRPRVPKKAAAWDDHFVVPGRITLDLPIGNYSFEVERGLEYLVVRGHFSINNSLADDSQKLELQRFTDLSKEGWWSGDVDVRRPAQDIQLLMQAEDLHVVPLQTWWNGHTQPLLPKTAEKQLLVSFPEDRYAYLMAGEQTRPGGSLLYFNLPAPLNLGAANSEYPPISKDVSKARETTHAWIDATRPYWWDLPAWVANHDVDSIQVLNGNVCRGKVINQETGGKPRDLSSFGGPWGNAQWSQEIYFHLLNCGLRMPLTAGSGSGVAPNPVGYNRVYVYVPEEFSYDKWWEGLRAGRVVLTNGPILVPKVNGFEPGHVFQAAKGEELELEVGLTLSIRDPDQQQISYLEVVENDQVKLSIRFAEYAKSGKLPRLRFQRSGWFLLRVVTDFRPSYRFAMTGPYWVDFGDERPVSKRSAKFFLDWVYERARQIQIDNPAQRSEVLQYHRKARDFWQDLLSKANAD